MIQRLALCAGFAFLALLGVSISLSQPELPASQPSQEASVSQTIGISQVNVSYHRPGVKGRQIWGSLVPFGEVWRAGANENTTVSFSTPVILDGKTLPAGTYGLHTIPTKEEWTIIFSKNATSWGSFFYNQSEDALRMQVKPQPADFQEWLQYTFSDLTDSTGVLNLNWEKLRVPIPLRFNTHALVLANARDSYLRGIAGFSWQGFNQAAQYCVLNDIELNQAAAWVDRSIQMNENFNNLWTKSQLYEKMGKTAELPALRERAMKLATEGDINLLGYTYLNSNKPKEAIEMFERNVKAHPNSWNVYDSLAEGLAKSGDTKNAISNYEKALKLVADQTNKSRIQRTIAELKAK